MFHPYSFYLQKHKNAKIKRESALPFFSFPLLLHLVIHTPNAPNCLLLCPILPFGISHFAFWDVPFRLLGCPILPFGVSHFAIWGIPFRHLGYIFGTFRTMYSPDFRFAFFVFRCKIYAFSLSIRKMDLAPFCFFVILCFCILQMRNCFRSAIETRFIALTYSQFCES